MIEEIVRVVKEDYARSLLYLQSVGETPTYEKVIEDVVRLTLIKIQDKEPEPSQKMQDLSNIGDKLSGIEVLVLDFDGVLTDNKVFVNEEGVEGVICDRRDSLGLDMLRRERPDVELFVLSTESNNIVHARCKKLGLDCFAGVKDKLNILTQLVKNKNLTLKNVAYIGNDINDLECIKQAGIGVAVADSVPEVLLAADYVTSKKGGDGAVREFIELLIKK